MDAKSRGENFSRVFRWSQKCLPIDYLLVAKGIFCNHTVEKLDNTLTEYVKLASLARTDRHHVPLDVIPWSAHHLLCDIPAKTVKPGSNHEETNLN